MAIHFPDKQGFRFSLRDSLCGRADEKRTLLACVDATGSAVAQFVFLAGAPGSGKTTLLHHVVALAAARGAQAIYAKAEATDDAVPYSLLNRAIENWVLSVREAGPVAVANARQLLQRGLGTDTAILAQLFPSLGALVDAPDDDAFLSFETRKEHLTRVILGLFLLLSRGEKSLILLLDDLQWADEPSLRLLHALVSSSLRERLLVVAAHRDDRKAHFVLQRLRTHVERAAASHRTINVGPLSPADIVSMLDVVVGMPQPNAASLAALLVERTGGNAFSVCTLLEFFVAGGGVQVDEQTGRLTWDHATLLRTTIPATLRAFWQQRLAQLPSAAQQVVRAAACIGRTFSLPTLAHVVNQRTEICAALLPLGDIIVREAGTYHFAHDCVHEAAYAMVAADESQHLHYRAAEWFMQDAAFAHSAYDIARHLTAAGELATARFGKLGIAQALTEAARQARRLAAYGVAIEHLRGAKSLTVNASSEDEEQLYCACAQDYATCLGLDGNVADSEAAFAELEPRLPHALAKAQMHAQRVEVLSANGKFDLVIAAGRAGARWVGIHIPESPSMLQIVIRMLAATRALKGRTALQAAAAPETTNPEVLVGLRIMSGMCQPAYYSSKPMLGWLYGKHAEITFRHGNSCYATVSHIAYAMYLANGRQRPHEGAKFADAAVEISKHWAESTYGTVAAFLRAVFFVHFSHPTRRGDRDVETGMIVMRAQGEYYWAALCAFEWAQRPVFTSTAPLSAIAAMAAKAVDDGSPYPVTHGTVAVEMIGALAEFLQQAECPADLAALDDRVHGILARPQNPTGPFFYPDKINELVAATVLRNHAVAHEAAHHAFVVTELHGWHHTMPYYWMMAGLAAAQLARQARGRDRRRFMQDLRHSLRALRKWSRLNRVNFAAHHLLLEAVATEIGRRPEAAKSLFAQAVEASRTQESILLRAITFEHAARASLGRHERDDAATLLAESIALYEQWHAWGKGRVLRAELAVIRGVHEGPAPIPKRHADGLSAIDAIRSMSRTTEPQETMAVLARQAHTLSGASRVVLLAAGPHAPLRPMVDTATASRESSAPLPSSVIDYAQRSGTPLVVSRPAEDPRFRHDVVLQSRSLASILCIPLHHKGDALGVLYAEHVMGGDGVDASVLEVLVLLTEQASTLLHAAKQRADLHLGMSRRSQALEAAHGRIVALERSAVEAQLAGGFAHEMRNALAPAALRLEAALQDARTPGAGPTDLRRRIDASLAALPPGPEHGRIRAWVGALTDVTATLIDAADAGQRGLRRGCGVIDRVLDYATLAQAERGHARINVSDLVQEVLIEAQDASTAGVRVDAHVPDGILFTASPLHIRALLTHLLRNAYDAIAEQHRAGGLIEVTLRRQESDIVFQVRDNGVGIPREDLDRVCNPFFSTKGAAGIGLGLAIVQRIVTLYEGTITCESAPGNGATFTVAFPVTQDD